MVYPPRTVLPSGAFTLPRADGYRFFSTVYKTRTLDVDMRITSQPSSVAPQAAYRLHPGVSPSPQDAASAPQHHVAQNNQRYGFTLIELFVAIPVIGIPLGWTSNWLMKRRHRHNLNRLLTTGQRAGFWRAPKEAVAFRQGLERQQDRASRATDAVGMLGGAGAGLGMSKVAVQQAGIEDTTTEALIHGGSVVAGGAAGLGIAQLAKPKVLAKVQEMALARFQRK